MSREHYRSDGGTYVQRYFTQMPNIIDDSDLSVYEFRLLFHYYRVGRCWEGVRKTAEICQMSTGKVAQSRTALEEKGYISISKHGDGVIISIIDKSYENTIKYSSRGERGVQDTENKGSCGEHKKNPIKNNQLRRDEAFPASPQKPTAQQQKEPEQLSLTPPPDDAGSPYTRCVNFWMKGFPSHEGWAFTAAHGKAMKTIIGKIKQYCTAKNIAPTDDIIYRSFEHLCVNLPVWYVDKDLHTINSKFNEIITEIQHGKKQRPSISTRNGDIFSDFAGLI